MIGNTHFDPVWLWRWDEAMSSITATFRSALDRMNEYPEFTYSFATPPVFEWIRHTSPDMLEEIKARVREGRWELAEGWWVQPDCYSASGESYVRQGLYAQRYLKDNFGQYADTVFNIDSFGHSPMLPQILKKSGIDYYVMCRPEQRHIPLDAPLFNWRSPDGTIVLTYRDDAPYKKNVTEAMDAFGDIDSSRMMVYGVTDHGGAPTKQAIEDIRSREDACCSTVRGFFEDNPTTDYTVDCELVTGDFGPYANHGDVKALNRIAEYTLLNAERSAVVAGVGDKSVLTKCWQDVLFNQFHDILGGASIRDAYFDSRNSVGGAIATAGEMLHYNLLRVTNKIAMPGKNPDNPWNIVVWNLNMFDYSGYIEAEAQWLHEFPKYDKGIYLEDQDGTVYPCQIIREKSVIPGFRSRFLFKAKVPSLGYKAFRVVQSGEEITRLDISPGGTLHTERYDIRLSPDSSMIESVYDKLECREIARALLHPVCYEDDGDTWEFGKSGYGKECEAPTLMRVEIVESGDMRTTVKASYDFRSSKIFMYYTVYKSESYMDVRYRVNWNEKHIVFKLVSELPTDKHRVSIPYGSVMRSSSSADLPMGEWIELAEFAFLPKRIFAYSLVDNRLGLTVLRSPIYGDLRIREIDLDLDYDIMEQGICEGEVRVLFGTSHSIEEAAVAFNNSPIVLCESNHTGTLPSEHSFLSADTDGVLLTVIKRAEDTDDVILRGCETRGKAGRAEIDFGGKHYSIDLSPYEIFTVSLDGECARGLDMLERELEKNK